ncbi:hypothetical protein [Pseudoalteromonas arctica]|uniref:Integrase n=1 Tax=Pseudoalteromonas arctica TaxID=394751 RepID=A0ABU9TDL4_9GAMM
MTLVSSLSSAKNQKRLNHVRSQIKQLKLDVIDEFQALTDSKKVLGEWDDTVWIYKNKNLYFNKPFDQDNKKVSRNTKAKERVPLPPLFSNIIKLYVLCQIKKDKTASAISSDIIANSWLLESISYQENKLITLKQTTLDDVIPLLEKHFKKRGPFERYKEMVRFTKSFLVPNKLVLSFAPKVNMPNPAIAQNNVTSKEYKARNIDKYDAEIDKYLGIVKQRFDEDTRRIKAKKPALYPEPKKGYDELRLLAIPFLFAFGLRIGELCRLTKDCLQYDEINERWYLNVLTEKGELPTARPIPRLWQEILIESHKRILQITGEFRAFAKQVEKTGTQAFIDVLNFDDRPEHVKEALIAEGYDPDIYFLRSEIGLAGDVHSSGLARNSCRHSKHVTGVFADAEVGIIKCRNHGLAPAIQTVLSKEVIAKLAIKIYSGYSQLIYKENLINKKGTDTYSSSSFSAEVPFSEHLFIVKDEFFHGGSNSLGFIPKPMTAKAVVNWITEDTSRSKTVFKRYGIIDGEGKCVSFSSHQFRHWLTTALMRSGKNEMMIDLFMGRKAGQSRQYDHRTAKERAEAIRQKYMGDNVPDDALGRRVLRMRENNVSLDEIETALNHTLSVVHFTPWGTCNRDLDVSPCEKGMMCLRGEQGKGCQHFGIDTSDIEAKQSIINTKAHYENQLSALLPNYQNLNEKLNNKEPLDQHIQYCIDTINGCESALNAYKKSEEHEAVNINIVQIFNPGVTVNGK